MSESGGPDPMDDAIQLHATPGPTGPKGGSGRIHVWQHVLDEIDEHVGSDTTVEQGGVLVGRVDDSTDTTLITARIPALGAISEVASLTFTHETWDYINEVMEQDHDGLSMVGWYHSHPHFGIFLSEYDQFIHRNFFSQPWQVAYVVDPLLDQRGFFSWVDGELVRVPSWQTWHTEGGPDGPGPGGTEPPAPPPPVAPVAPVTAAVPDPDPAGAAGPAVDPDGPSALLPPPAPPDVRRRRWVAAVGISVAAVAAVVLVFAFTGGNGGEPDPAPATTSATQTTVPPAAVPLPPTSSTTTTSSTSTTAPPTTTTTAAPTTTVSSGP